MNETALDLLYSMEVDENTQRGRERRGLVAVLEHRYWQQSGVRNPLLRVTPDVAAWLLLMGAAKDEIDCSHIAKVRSIKPVLRQNVLDLLLLYKGKREGSKSSLLFLSQRNKRAPILLLVFSLVMSLLSFR
jgi:hypothetical protein